MTPTRQVLGGGRAHGGGRRRWGPPPPPPLPPPPAVTARADPAISIPGPGERKAEWIFSNPSNYTLDNITLDASGGFLTWQPGSATDKDSGDFSRAPTLVNVDLAGTPGGVAILNTSQQGAPQNLTDVPTPAGLADTYLFHGSGGNDNYGLASDMNVGFNGSGPWYRALIRFPSFPLPFNAVVRYAELGPQLLITYTTPGSSALLESRVLDAGGASVWGALWWNTTRPPGTSVAVQTRSGNASVVDVTWSPWSAPYPAIGSPITSPAARYLEYRLSLFTPTNSTPIVHDVSAAWIHHAASGLVVTERLLPENLTGRSRVQVGWTRPAA